MKDPNNIRNRWRRYRATRIAYNFTFLPFREWAPGWGRNPSAYEAGPVHLRQAEPDWVRSNPAGRRVV